MCVKVSQSVALFKVSHIDPSCHIALSMTYTHSNSFTVVTVSQTTLDVSQLCVSVSLGPCVAGPCFVILLHCHRGVSHKEISLGVDVKHMELETLQWNEGLYLSNN